MATNDALIGRVLGGRYLLQARRGAGGHGIVVDAVDEQLQRPVAVKIMLPQYVATQAAEARFRLEAQVAASMTHPNLNAVYDWGVEEVEGARVPYLALEHLPGGSLRDMLDRNRLLSPSQALMVGLDACRGLDYMHRRGVIHRDLTPANLAFGDDRHLRLLDVGISRMVAEQTWRVPSAAGLDAARYASPEQAKGGSPQDGTLDASTDIYSLCLILIEAVTGQVPFASDSTVATLNARIDKLMPVSADFGPLASVLSRAGSSDPTQRYTAAAFGRALVQAAEKLPRPAPIPIVGGSGMYGDVTGGIRRPTDPTGPLQRTPLSADGPSTEALITMPVIAPHPDGVPLDAPSAPVPPISPAAVAPAPLLRLSLAEDLPVADDVMGPSPFVVVPATPPPPGATAAMPAARVAPVAPVPQAAQTAPIAPAFAVGTQAVPTVAPVDQLVLKTDPTGAAGEPHVYNQEYDEPRRGKAGWIIAAFVVVIAIAAGGFIAYRMVGEKKHTVPNLVGVAESVARNQIAEDNWIVAVTDQRSDTQPQGTIISTDPAAGVSLKEGQTITFVVSGGPTLATLPEVTGKTVDEATALLTAAKLDIVVSAQDFSEIVPSGTIISWMVPAQAGLTAGMQVTQRTVVAVDVSKGPAPRTVPNLVGADIATATKTLNDLGLLILRDPADVFSPTVPVGQIAAQSVPVGTKANRGDTITVAVSKGVEKLPVPSLATLTLDQIKSTLVGAGFVVGKISGPSTTGLLARVSTGGADVTLGELLPRNSVLDLEFIAPPPPPTTVAAPPAT